MIRDRVIVQLFSSTIVELIGENRCATGETLIECIEVRIKQIINVAGRNRSRNTIIEHAAAESSLTAGITEVGRAGERIFNITDSRCKVNLISENKRAGLRQQKLVCGRSDVICSIRECGRGGKC